MPFFSEKNIEKKIGKKQFSMIRKHVVLSSATWATARICIGFYATLNWESQQKKSNLR